MTEERTHRIALATAVVGLLAAMISLVGQFDLRGQLAEVRAALDEWSPSSMEADRRKLSFDARSALEQLGRSGSWKPMLYYDTTPNTIGNGTYDQGIPQPHSISVLESLGALSTDESRRGQFTLYAILSNPRETRGRWRTDALALGDHGSHLSWDPTQVNALVGEDPDRLAVLAAIEELQGFLRKHKDAVVREGLLVE